MSQCMDFQQCGMCDQQSLRPACAYVAQAHLRLRLSKCQIVGNHFNSGLCCQAIVVLAYAYLSKPEVSHLVSSGPFIIKDL